MVEKFIIEALLVELSTSYTNLIFHFYGPVVSLTQSVFYDGIRNSNSRRSVSNLPETLDHHYVKGPHFYAAHSKNTPTPQILKSCGSSSIAMGSTAQSGQKRAHSGSSSTKMRKINVKTQRIELLGIKILLHTSIQPSERKRVSDA